MRSIQVLCFRMCLAVFTVCLALMNPLAQAAGSDDSDALEEVREAIDGQDYSQAIKLLQELLADDPQDADALNLMGYSYRKSGQLEQALSYYRQALRIDPKHLGANEYLGELYLQRGELDKAQQRLSVLDGACFLPCEEYTDLKHSIADYRQRKGLN